MFRKFLISILPIFLLTVTSYAQNKIKPKASAPWNDTTLINVKLIDTITDSKVAIINIGEKAIIYIKVKSIIDQAKKYLTDDFIKKDYQIIIDYLDSASLKSDSIFIGEYYKLLYLQYLIDDQLLQGNARVYYKKNKTFVDSIFHRLERYGQYGDRFFYLPDKRPFFFVIEITGILDKQTLYPHSNYDAYMKEADKLEIIMKE